MDTKIFINGKIYTSNTETPYASAMVVRHGRIDWIGDQAAIPETNGEQIDLQNKSVIPSFIDAHLHPLYLADAQNQIACSAPNVYSIADLIERIQEQRQDLGTDQWVESWGYDEGKLTDRRAPTRYDLDKGAADVPVVVTRTCGHILAVNSKALELAGIDKDTKAPAGGEIDRDKNGEPTGILRESAKDLVKDVMPEKTLFENANSIASLTPALLKHGITAITDLMAHHDPIDYLEMYQVAMNKGLKQRTVLYYTWEEFQKLSDEAINDLTDRNNPVHIGGIKLFADGSISGQTAWVNPGYVDNTENFGIATTEKETLLSAAQAAEKHKIQLVVHAMGEQAIDLIVDTFYGQKGWIEAMPSIRIEHATLPTAKTMKRAAEAGIAFVPQPVFLYAEIESYLHNLGMERTKQAYPVKSMLDAGVKVAFSSDAPATPLADPVNPFVGLKSAVTRKAHDGTDTGQEERIDVETAISLYTKAAQEITGIPDVGQLAAGYHADFIVLDRDILAENPETIDQTIVEETYMGGELAYTKKNEDTIVNI